MRAVATIVMCALLTGGTPAGTDPGAGPDRAGEILARLSRGLRGSADEPLRGFRATYRAIFSLGERAAETERTVSFELPDRIRYDAQVPGGVQTLVFEGEAGWLAIGDRAMPLSTERVSDARREIGLDPLGVACGVGAAGLEAEVRGQETIDGIGCDVLAVRFLGAESTLWIDGTGRVRRQTYAAEHPTEHSRGTMQVHFEDYRDGSFPGLAHRRVLEFDGRRLATVTIEALEPNPPFVAGHFASGGGS